MRTGARVKPVDTGLFSGEWCEGNPKISAAPCHPKTPFQPASPSHAGWRPTHRSFPLPGLKVSLEKILKQRFPNVSTQQNCLEG